MGVVLGALILVPSLALLFGLVLKGRFDAPPRPPADAEPRPVEAASQRLLLAVSAGGLATGVVFLTLLEGGWAHAVGVVGLFAFVGAGFVAIAASEPAERSPLTPLRAAPLQPGPAPRARAAARW